MIVVDVGCAHHGGQSINYLIEEFSPRFLVGLDPHPSLKSEAFFRGPTLVVTIRAAAWVHDGPVGFYEAGLGSCVSTEPGLPLVPAVNLTTLIPNLAAEGDEIVLKIDAEGSEYVLLPHLIRRGLDRLLAFAWVEWHEPMVKKAKILRDISCPIDDWRL